MDFEREKGKGKRKRGLKRGFKFQSYFLPKKILFFFFEEFPILIKVGYKLLTNKKSIINFKNFKRHVDERKFLKQIFSHTII
jgi:ABC-type sugar transport system permease subunit